MSANRKSQGVLFGGLLWEGLLRAGLLWGAVLMSALALGGCATSIADLPLVGTPADAPARTKQQGGYLPVEDLPPNRDEAAIAPAEQAKIKAELLAARDRQASASAAKDQAAAQAQTGK